MMKPDEEELTNVDLEAEESPPEAPVESMLGNKVEKPIENAREDGNGNGRQILLIILGVSVTLALVVGLSVGLTRDSDSGITAPTFNVSLDAISSKTIQQSYRTCEDLRGDLVQASGYLANSVIESNAQWYFHQEYRNKGGFSGGGDIAVLADSESGSSSNGIPTPTEPAITEDSFGTNNQVEGVEEADVVQSNGEQVFVSYGKEVVVLEADNVTVTSRRELPVHENCTNNNIASMLLIDDRLVVITTGWCDTDSTTIVRGRQITQALVYDIEDMSLLSTESLQGIYVSARAIGPNVHIVTSAWLSKYYSFTQYLDPYDENIYRANINENDYRNQAHFEAQDRMDGFVNQLVDELDCESVQQLALFQDSEDELTFSGILESMASVYSFSIVEDGSLSSTSMVLPTSNWQVYASEERLVLAGQGWSTLGDEDVTQETYLLSYRLDGANATAMSLGTVPGYVLNQFSIDHIKQNGTDFLRVATSTRERWTFGNRRWTQTEDSTSQVTVLEVNDGGDLPIVGQLNGLGKPGERIYSVRFQGDQGFVVTFRETDPFYTLNLADPYNPQAVGELEIPGFSNYLHPIDGDLIIGVGQHVDEETGARGGLQVSLFDVSDFANPQRIQNYVEDGGYSTSNAQYDHRAFRYLPESQILILPLTIYGHRTQSDSLDGFRLYKIDAAAGISLHMTIEHANGDFYNGCWSYTGFLQPRSLVFAGDVMTTKGHSIMSHDLTTGLEDTAPIQLDEGLTDCSPYYFE